MERWAIIAAAGRGLRFGAAKQYELLRGRPLLLYPLELFESSPLIDGICLVIPESDSPLVGDLLRTQRFTKKILVVGGGKERQHSVQKGVESIPPCDLIVVHDGVRPFVTQEILRQVVDEADRCGGAVVGMPVKETTKMVGPEGWISETVDRSSLWSIQTPQAFRYTLFKEALAKADRDDFLGTDESMLVERLGEKVKVIEGSPYNIKITTPEDLKIAEAILHQWNPR